MQTFSLVEMLTNIQNSSIFIGFTQIWNMKI